MNYQTKYGTSILLYVNVTLHNLVVLHPVCGAYK
jgi:hypothetical protein